VVENFWEVKPTSRHGPGFSFLLGMVTTGSLWYRIPPVAICDASTSSSNCWLGSGRTRTGAFVTAVMSFSIASVWGGPHSNGMFLPNSFVMGAAISEKWGMNMQWYLTTLMKLQAPLIFQMFLGHSLIPAILAGLTVTPSFEMRTPRKSICGCMKMLLDSLRWSPCAMSMLKRLCIIARCNAHSD